MSKEHDKFKAEQEIKKAAELKAKLDLVETKPKPRWGRHPKKIGEIVCDTGVKNGYRTESVKYALRLDGSDFIAEHGDTWYVSRSRDALQAKMNEVSRIQLDLRWTRYLHVAYTMETPSDTYSRTSTLDVDDPRTKDTVVYGIDLRWSIVEYSDPFQLPGNDPKYMKREVDKDGNPSSTHETVTELPDGLVPYTEEREATLLRLRAALANVDAKMVELFRGAPDRVAKQLDAVPTSTSNGMMLLQAPDTTKPKKIKR